MASEKVDLDATFEKYCGFVAEQQWHLVDDVAVTLDQEARDALVALAMSPDASRSVCAELLLSVVQDVRLVPILAAVVADPSESPSTRKYACNQIMPFATIEALPAMLAALSEPLDLESNAGLQRCAIKALGNIDDDAARERLRELLPDPSYAFARSRIILALGSLRDEAAVAQLIAFAIGPNGPVGEKFAATEALGRIGTPESIVPLLEVLESIPPGHQRWVLGVTLAGDLEAARDRSEDTAFQAELDLLIDAIRALAKERPLQ